MYVSCCISWFFSVLSLLLSFSTFDTGDFARNLVLRSRHEILLTIIILGRYKMLSLCRYIVKRIIVNALSVESKVHESICMYTRASP